MAATAKYGMHYAVHCDMPVALVDLWTSLPLSRAQTRAGISTLKYLYLPYTTLPLPYNKVVRWV